MSIWLLLLLEEVSNQRGKTSLLRVTPIPKAALGDCIAACPIASFGCWCCNIFPTHSFRHGVLLPSTGYDACVSPVKQDLKLLVSYRTKRIFPSPPARISHAVLLSLHWYGSQLCGVLAEHVAFLWKEPVLHRVTGLDVAILSSSSWYKSKFFS